MSDEMQNGRIPDPSDLDACIEAAKKGWTFNFQLCVLLSQKRIETKLGILSPQEAAIQAQMNELKFQLLAEADFYKPIA